MEIFGGIIFPGGTEGWASPLPSVGTENNKFTFRVECLKWEKSED